MSATEPKDESQQEDVNETEEIHVTSKHSDVEATPNELNQIEEQQINNGHNFKYK